MPRDKDETRQPRMARCSFCDKPQDQVRRIVAGPGVYICDECITLCQEIIADDIAPAHDADAADIPRPTEIKAVLESMGLDFGMKIDNFEKKYQEWKRKQHHEA